MKQARSFTEGPILLPLVRFALPVLAALFLQALYGAVDLWVVGQYGSPVDVSAVSTGSQVMHTVTVLINGLSMGITILVGQQIGRGKPQEAGAVIGTGVCMFLLGAVGVTIAAAAGAAPLSRLLQAPPEAFADTVTYIRICAGGAVFIVAYNVLGSIFRGIGDSKMPLIAVVIACVCNIAGDLLLVAGFGMGAAGAACATVFAQAVSVLLSLVIIRRRPLPFSFTRADLRLDRAHLAHILRLGSPVALQDLLVNISFLVLVAIANSMGVIASSGVGVAEKLCGFIMLVPSSFMQSMSAFVAQNIGAGKPERAKKTLFYGILASLTVGVVIGGFTFFRGGLLAGLFARDRDIVLAAAQYLKAYAIDTLLTAFLFCFIGYFNGLGKTFFVMVQGIAGAFLVRIPTAFFISRLPGVTLFHIGLATPCSTAVQIILCVGYYLLLRHRETAALSR